MSPSRIRRNRLSLEALEERRVPALFSPSPSAADGQPGSLRAAIAQANNNNQSDLIQLAAGTYELTLAGKYDDNNLSGDLDLTEAGFTVTIRGAGADRTTIDANLLDRVIHLTAGRLVLEDVRITGGLSIRDDNTPIGTNGFPVVQLGGGAWLDNFDETHEIRRVLIDNNVSDSGSGIGGGRLLVESSSVVNNGSTTLSRVGGIAGFGTILNSTISGNSGSNIGGITSGFTVESATITDNIVVNDHFNTGGGMGGDCQTGAYSTVSNSIIAGNTDSLGNPDDFGCLSDRGNNILGTGEILQSQPSPATIFSNDPRLGPLQNNGGSTPTHLPLSGSPAINAGSQADPPATDQRGVVRPQSGIPDIGAVEVAGTPPPPTQRHASDVDGNGTVSLSDAFLIIAELRRTGPRDVEPNPTSGHDYDVTNDGRLTISDALEVVRYLVLQRNANLQLASSSATKTMATANEPVDAIDLSSLAEDDGLYHDALLAEQAAG